MKVLFILLDDRDYQQSIERYLSKNPEAQAIFYNAKNKEKDNFFCERKLLIENYEDLIKWAVLSDRVVLLSESRPSLDDDLLVALFSFSEKSVVWVNSVGYISNMRSGVSSSILFVFPGPILPLNLGSHQRAYNLLSNLKNIGYAVDILIPQVDKAKESNLVSSLLTVCENVYFYKNKKKKFKKIDLFKRGLEKKIRKFIGKNEILQDKFSERCFNKPTVSAKRKVNSLYHAKNYPIIIVSYAWMMDVLDLVEPFLSDKTKIICDTHDVQFERSKGYLNRKERIFFSEGDEKKMELAQLNRADAVLSISNADKRILEKEDLKADLINLSAGFDYQLRAIKARPSGKPLNFGFIGGAMDANVKALELIIKEWWPVIKMYSPESTLFIAGSVAKNELINQLMLFDEKISSVGFVKNLDDFYNLIDVSLNPVLVQGGLNFKSVEAVFAGKHLLTNQLGKECLTNEFECGIINNPSDIIDYIRKFEFDIEEDKRMRRKSQESAKKIFTNKKVIAGFDEYLKDIIN
jgi:hypothetical protein